METVFIPMIVMFVGVYGLYNGVDVFSCFVTGAKKGLKTAVSLIPILVGLLSAVHMMRASGVIDLVGQILSPVVSALGLPKECTALALLKPISGGGGLAVGSDIISEFGVNSYVGRVAAVMLGASETSLYTISVYCGYLGLKKTRYAVPSALAGDAAAFIASAWLVRFFQ